MIRTCIGIYFFVVVISCANRQTSISQPSDVRLKLDSVFINLYERGTNDDIPYIFFFYTIENRRDDTIGIKLRVRRTDLMLDKYHSYCVYARDTLEIFAGNFTPGNFSLAPGEKKSIDFNLDTIELMDYIKKNSIQDKSEQQILKELAGKGVNIFSWKGIEIIDRGPRKIFFRDPNDSSMVTWK